jgi:hypothetical protein
MDSREGKTKRIRPKVGDLFVIPLPDGHFAFGKVFRDASVGIYSEVQDSPKEAPIGSSFEERFRVASQISNIQIK